MPEQIVVGVDGSAAAEKALIWAAETAARTGARLVIAHGDSGVHVTAPAGVTVDFHHQLMREAVATAIEVCDCCDISTILRSETPDRLLLELGETADLLVVGSRGAGAVAGTLFGSIAYRVAAHARCPVVVLPEGWRVSPADEPRPVSVGVSPSVSGRQALEFAFGEAERRHVPLVAVRAWAESDWTARVADFVTPSHDSVRHREQAQLTALVDEAWRRHPSVEVDLELSSETLYSALHGAAERSDLLVIGCRNDDHLLSRLGAVAMRLLHTSPCPVVVVGQPAALDADHERAPLAAQSQSA